METTLGLIVGEDTSSSVSKMEQDYSTDTCTSESSSYISDETEIELRLGLGLSCGGGGGVTKAKKSTRSREYGRILTANDRPNGFKGGVNNNVASVSGIKRGADSVGSSSEISGLLPRVSRQVVGWPPIRTYRMNSLVNQSKVTNVEQEKLVEGNEKEENSKKKINHENTKNDVATIKENDQLGFVKVNMNGLPITRMVDLNAHYCYDTLAKTLEEMFFKSTISHEKKEELPKSYKLLDGSSEFVLTYEDKDGDWMLVGDVPWGMFLSTVERLKIMRTSEASGVGM